MPAYISLKEDELHRQYCHLLAKGVFAPGQLTEDDYVALCESEDGPLATTKRAIDHNSIIAVFFQHEIQALFCDREECGHIMILELDNLADVDQATIWNYLHDEKSEL